MTQAELRYQLIQTRGLEFEVATAGEGDRLALLLHGFPETAHCWRHQVATLTGLGYRVWAPNLRGYGRSSRPRGVAQYSLERLETDVTDLIDESCARSVLLVGHDWGGAVAWSYAMHGTRPIERLIILNSPHPRVFARALRSGPQLRRSWYMLLFQLPLLPELLMGAHGAALLGRSLRDSALHPECFSEADLRIYRDNASQPGALTAMINYYRAMGRVALRGSGRRGTNIQVPTLLIWGEQDSFLGTELIRGTERYVDKLTVQRIPDASHWVQQDSPAAVNACLEAWLIEPKPEQLSTQDVLHAQPTRPVSDS